MTHRSPFAAFTMCSLLALAACVGSDPIHGDILVYDADLSDADVYNAKAYSKGRCRR